MLDAKECTTCGDIMDVHTDDLDTWNVSVYDDRVELTCPKCTPSKDDELRKQTLATAMGKH